MNQPALLHIVERLEGFLSRLPEKIQKPILTELTPLKELFLQQRPPRFVFAGSAKLPAQQLLGAIFPGADSDAHNALIEIGRWQDLVIAGVGSIAVFDVRTASDAVPQPSIGAERVPADVIFYVDDGEAARAPRKKDIDALAELAH